MLRSLFLPVKLLPHILKLGVRVVAHLWGVGLHSRQVFRFLVEFLLKLVKSDEELLILIFLLMQRSLQSLVVILELRIGHLQVHIVVDLVFLRFNVALNGLDLNLKLEVFIL